MKKDIEIIKPKDIEKRSFEIIQEELDRRVISIDEETSFVTKRVIHTTADFEYAKTLKFSNKAIDIAESLLKDGADIVTDTNMGLSGINKKVLESLGGSVHCFMADESVAKEAAERGVTRATVSMERAAKIKKPVIFAIGNAPTALISIYEMMQQTGWKPDFVIGVPVGFVNVEAAKELFLETDIPYIINIGRKGGSNVAAAICNALLYDIKKERA
ncbi:MAG: precorrin-8X methylmutase [Lachnospiraceae bacterium]|nr:precorrin-8X methylmutase [Lachnospiraceae bacterium]